MVQTLGIVLHVLHESEGGNLIDCNRPTTPTDTATPRTARGHLPGNRGSSGETEEVITDAIREPVSSGPASEADLEDWQRHREDGYCACRNCLDEHTRQRWEGMTLEERESVLFSRFMSRNLDHVAWLARDAWHQEASAGELEPEDYETIRRYLIKRVVRAGGGRDALALLHRVLRAAMEEAANVGPDLIEWGPEDQIEWWETEGGCVVAGGYILADSAYDVLETFYEQAWTDALSELFRLIARSPDDPAEADVRYSPERFILAILDAATVVRGTPAGHRPPQPPPRQHEALGPILRTGPPAKTWAAFSQVLPVAA